MSDAELWQRYGWDAPPNLASLDELMKVRRALADRPASDVAILARYLIPRLLDIDVGTFNSVYVFIQLYLLLKFNYMAVCKFLIYAGKFSKHDNGKMSLSVIV